MSKKTAQAEKTAIVPCVVLSVLPVKCDSCGKRIESGYARISVKYTGSVTMAKESAISLWERRLKTFCYPCEVARKD